MELEYHLIRNAESLGKPEVMAEESAYAIEYGGMMESILNGTYDGPNKLYVWQVEENGLYLMRGAYSTTLPEVKIGDAFIYVKDDVVYMDDIYNIGRDLCSFLYVPDAFWGTLVLKGSEFRARNRRDINELAKEGNLYFTHEEWYAAVPPGQYFKLSLCNNILAKILKEMLPDAEIDCDVMHLMLDGKCVGHTAFYGNKNRNEFRRTYDTNTQDPEFADFMYIEGWGVWYYTQDTLMKERLSKEDYVSTKQYVESAGIITLYPDFDREYFEAEFIKRLKTYVG